MNGIHKMQDSLNRTGESRRLSIRIVALFTGFLLFSASFSLLLNDVFFNSELYKSAFERLGIYGSLSEIAGNPVREFSGKISLSDTAEQSIQLKSMIEDNVSDQMLHLNTDTLVSGLISYFKGDTNSLPNLTLSGSTDLPSVNLQALMMYTGENRISNIFGIIRLAQCVLVYIPAFLLLLLPILFINVLKKSTDDIKSWVTSSVFSYWLISLSAAILVQVLPDFLIIPAMVKAHAILPSLSMPLSKLFIWFQNFLTFFILLSATLLYVGVRLSGLLLQNKYLKNSLPVSPIYRKNTVLIPVIVLLSGTLFFAAVHSASLSFENRNLEQTLSLLWENNPICPVTDARNDLVYLLEVHAVDSNSKPVPYIGIKIYKNNDGEADSQEYAGMTDEEGNSDFLLDKGFFSIELEPYEVFIGYSNPHEQSFPFQMLTPGKSVLNVMLDRTDDGLLHVANASLQFIP